MLNDLDIDPNTLTVETNRSCTFAVIYIAEINAALNTYNDLMLLVAALGLCALIVIALLIFRKRNRKESVQDNLN